MPSARTIKARNGKYYKCNAESIRSSDPLVSNIVLIQSPKSELLVSNNYKTNPERKRRTARQQYRINPEPKRRTAHIKAIIIIIVLIQSQAIIIIILGETRLPHSLAKPDCYARSNSPDNCS